MDHPAPAPTTDQVAALRDSLRGGLLEPGDDGYDAARVVWNGMIERRPAFIARCAGVIESLAFARRHALPLSIRGGELRSMQGEFSALIMQRTCAAKKLFVSKAYFLRNS